MCVLHWISFLLYVEKLACMSNPGGQLFPAGVLFDNAICNLVSYWFWCFGFFKWTNSHLMLTIRGASNCSSYLEYTPKVFMKPVETEAFTFWISLELSWILMLCKAQKLTVGLCCICFCWSMFFWRMMSKCDTFCVSLVF